MESNLVETLITTNAIGAVKGEEFYWKRVASPKYGNLEKKVGQNPDRYRSFACFVLCTLVCCSLQSVRF